MKILCADALADDPLQPLRDAGHEVLVEADLSADTIPERLAGDTVEVLVVRSTKVETGNKLNHFRLKCVPQWW